ncbi:hypothetical protein GCM10009682_49280 [Luedemannella flava]|uniref:Tetratricopeptide repeat protein n=1 Tax=Luedemannella flava TaxID=349316 RepID=A0ABP4YRX9_9ACTN
MVGVLAAAALALWLGAWGPGHASGWLAVPAALAGWALLHLWQRMRMAGQATRAAAVEILLPKSDNENLGDEIVAELRQALTVVHLSSPSVVPGESTPQDFLTDVRTAATGTSGWGLLAMAVGRLRRTAYQVTLVPRADGGRHGLTVEVACRPTRENEVATVYGRNWADAAHQAAYHVAAFVLPRTALSHQPPWIPWHGVQLNAGLFYNFHEARRLAAAGRYEEALRHFDAALEEDPLSPYIRVEKATVLDQLGLYLDALATYVDVVAIECRYDLNAWTHYQGLTRYGAGPKPQEHTRSPSGPAALQLARYRMVGSLAASDRLADQWVRNQRKAFSQDDQSERAEEATRVIARLRRLLRHYADLMVDAHGVRQALAEGRGLSEPVLAERDIENHRPTLRRVLQYAALHEARALKLDYGTGRADPALPISRGAIRVLPIWATLQYRYLDLVAAVSGQAHHDPGPLPPDLPALNDTGMRTFVKELVGNDGGWPVDQWPPPAKGVQKLVVAALDGHGATDHGWHEHYNAACVYAVGMLTPELYPGLDSDTIDVVDRAADDHRALVRHAIDQLTQAVFAADSHFAGGAAPWLGQGDQDLNDLRVTDGYRIFADRFLPRTSAPPLIPRNVALLSISGHLVHLVELFARQAREHWAARAVAKGAEQSINPVALRTEAIRWRQLGAFCLNYRDWPTRHRLIELAGGKINAALPTIDSDLRWVRYTKAILEEDRRKDEERRRAGAGSRGNVARWLSISAELDRYALHTVSVRNQALDLLGCVLTAAAESIEDATRFVADRPGTHDARTSEAFADAWAAVEEWMWGLRNDAGPGLRPGDAHFPEEPDATAAREKISRIWPESASPDCDVPPVSRAGGGGLSRPR